MVLWDASLPSSQPAGFLKKIIIPCPNTSSLDLLASCDMSSRTLDLITWSEGKVQKNAQRGAMLLALEMEKVAKTKQCRQPLETGKGKEMDWFWLNVVSDLILPVYQISQYFEGRIMLPTRYLCLHCVSPSPCYLTWQNEFCWDD